MEKVRALLLGVQYPVLGAEEIKNEIVCKSATQSKHGLVFVPVKNRNNFWQGGCSVKVKKKHTDTQQATLFSRRKLTLERFSVMVYGLNIRKSGILS